MASAKMANSVAIFLFAHQDDEFGIFHKIIMERQSGRQIFCVYLTDGGELSQRRNVESLTVLKKLGIYEQNILFIGAALIIPDSKLPEHLKRATDWLHSLLSSMSEVAAIYMPAWEGGHQDHDALHAITVIVAHKMGILSRVKQFPLYNAYGCIGPLFRLFQPLPSNGEVEKAKIPWANRIRFLRYCLSYPSQKITWMGLFPFVIFHYLASGMQILQSVSRARIHQRPHDGALYYEKRRFYTWERIAAHLSAFEITIVRDLNATTDGG